MYIKQLFIIFISSYLLISCASDSVSRNENKVLRSSGSDCISIGTIRDYIVLNNRNILVEGAGRRSYLLELYMSSFNLNSAFQLGVQSRDDWLCPYGGDQIIVGRSISDKLPIKSITKLNKEELEQVLIRFGKIEGPKQKTPEPKPQKGAEVEELGQTT